MYTNEMFSTFLQGYFTIDTHFYFKENAEFYWND